MKTATYKNLFNKIKLLDSMANQLVGYGVTCGYKSLPDYVDMNCGAIPDGEYELLVDENAPEQFLSMYAQIAEMRFAFAVTELLKIHDGLIKQISDFCMNVGEDLGTAILDNPEEIYSYIDSIVLDGMAGVETKQIIEKSSDKLVIKKLIDTHEASWKKAGGKLEIYYELQKSFINGLIKKSEYKYESEGGEIFTLTRM